MSKEYTVDSEKFLAEDETLGEYISSNGHGNVDDEVECVHHWVIEPPHGSTSSGTCKKCGEYKKDYFVNSMDNIGWAGRERSPKKRVSRKKGDRKGGNLGNRYINKIRDEDLR